MELQSLKKQFRPKDTRELGLTSENWKDNL